MALSHALRILLGVFTVAFSATAASDSVLVQILGSKFTGFVKMLEESNLLSDLETEISSTGGVTFFAPSDYFLSEKVSPAVLSFLSQPSNVDHLRSVLRNHVVPQKLDMTSWYNGMNVKTLAGSTINLAVVDGELRVGDSVVKELNVIEALDGVVNSISGFMLPADVVEAVEEFDFETSKSLRRELVSTAATLAPAPSPSAELVSKLSDALAASGKFDTVLNLLGTYGLLTDLTDLLGSGTTLTLFAPVDDAFNGIDFSGVNVTSVLLFHVVVGSYSYDELIAISNGTETALPSRRLLQTGGVNTVSGDKIVVTSSNGAVYLNGVLLSVPNVLSDSSLSSQGVSKVLSPAASPPPPPVSSPPPPPPKSTASHLMATLISLSMVFIATLCLV